MDYKNKIDEHMKNKFEDLDGIKPLKVLPDEQELNKMTDTLIYKVPFVCVFVDVVDFKKLTKYTSPKVVNSIMSEFAYGVTKIIKEFGGYQIQIQGDGIYGIFKGSTRSQIHDSFKCACALNSFQDHLNKNIKKHFDEEVKYEQYSWVRRDELFKFGIGMHFSFENFISKVGHGASRDLIFMGDSVSKASMLAKTANRNFNMKILLNDLMKANFPDDSNPVKDSFSGFTKVYIHDSNEYVWGCNWIIETYDNFVKNNV